MLGVGYLEVALSEVSMAVGGASLRVVHIGPPGGVDVGGGVHRAARPLKAAGRVNEGGVPLCQEPSGRQPLGGVIARVAGDMGKVAGVGGRALHPVALSTQQGHASPSMYVAESTTFADRS